MPRSHSSNGYATEDTPFIEDPIDMFSVRTIRMSIDEQRQVLEERDKARARWRSGVIQLEAISLCDLAAEAARVPCVRRSVTATACMQGATQASIYAALKREKDRNAARKALEGHMHSQLASKGVKIDALSKATLTQRNRLVKLIEECSFHDKVLQPRMAGITADVRLIQDASSSVSPTTIDAIRSILLRRTTTCHELVENGTAVIQAHGKFRQSLDTIIRCYIPLAVKIATDIRQRTVGLMDRLSFALTGLQNAAENFTTSKNIQFSTFATICIRNAIKRGRQHMQAIEIAAHVLDLGKRVELAEQQIMLKEGVSAVRADTVASALEVPLYKVHALRHCQTPISLEQLRMNEDSPFDPEDRRIPIATSETTDEQERLHRLLESGLLSDTEKTIISLRFGMTNDGEQSTLASIGRILGISRESVRQIEVKAIKKLRQHLLATDSKKENE